MNNPKDDWRLAFLQDLDDADHIDLTEWETDFVGNNCWSSRDEFTNKQREVIDKLIKKYQSKL